MTIDYSIIHLYKWRFRNNTKNDMIPTVTGLRPTTLCLRFSDGCFHDRE